MIRSFFITALFVTNPVLSQERLPVDFIPTKGKTQQDRKELKDKTHEIIYEELKSPSL